MPGASTHASLDPTAQLGHVDMVYRALAVPGQDLKAVRCFWLCTCTRLICITQPFMKKQTTSGSHSGSIETTLKNIQIERMSRSGCPITSKMAVNYLEFFGESSASASQAPGGQLHAFCA